MSTNFNPQRQISLLAMIVMSVLLIGCEKQAVPMSVRPVLVIQPAADTAGLSAFSGEVRARFEPVLGFRVGGKVVRRFVDVGARVKAGQPLAELDPQDLKLQFEAARAQVTSASAQFALAKSELDRYQDLLNKKLIGRSIFDSKLAAFQAAEAQIQQAKAQASVSRNQAAYSVLRAPKAGLIAARFVEAGQVVAPGQSVFSLAEDGEREVVIAIAEQQINQFKVGRDLYVELWAAPGKRYKGTLRELAPAADALTRTYSARVSFSSADSEAEIGQSARVYALDSQNSAMGLPLSAVMQNEQSASVWVVDKNSSKLRKAAVQIGAYTEVGVPILSGLQAQDWVVMAGVHLLREGEQVLALDRDNRSVLAKSNTPKLAPAKSSQTTEKN